MRPLTATGNASPARQRARRLRRGMRRFAGRHWLLLLGAVSPPAVASYLARGLAWHAGLRHVGVRISALRAVAVTIAGQVTALLPAGDLARVRLVQEAGGRGGGRAPSPARWCSRSCSP